MRHLLLLLFVALSIGRLPAQIQRIMHQTFPVGDSTKVITLDIYGEYEVETWPATNILVEIQVKLYNATRGILDHFIETGRFELEGQGEGGALLLVSKYKERRPITTSKGECFEEVKQRLFLPEEFSPQEEQRWVRSVEAEKMDQTARDSSAHEKRVPQKDDMQKQGSSNKG